MKYILSLLVAASLYMVYQHFYGQPMEELRADRERLELIEGRVTESKIKAAEFEKELNDEYNKTWRTNEAIKIKIDTNFSNGVHTLSI